MKRNIRSSLYFVLFGIITIYFAACGGGSPGDGTTPGPTGPKPVVVYSDNASVCGSAVTVTAKVDPNGSANYHFVLTDNRGGRQVSSTVTITGTGPQLVQASFIGVNPAATNTVIVEATNANGTASDFGSFPTWATPPAVTGITAINVTRTSGDIVVTVDPSLDPTMTDVIVRYGTDPTGMVYTQRSRPVPASLDNLVFSLSGYADNTQVYFWLATTHTWGNWVSEVIQSFTTLTAPVTITGQIGRFSTFYIDRGGDRMAYIVSGDGTNPANINYSGAPGEARFYYFLSGRYYVVYDTAGRNVFNLGAGSNLNVDLYPVSSDDANVTMVLNITGTGYSASPEAAGLIPGAWSDCIWRIDYSNAPPPSPQTGDNVAFTNNYTQDASTPNLVTISVSGLGPVPGAMNGKRLFVSRWPDGWAWKYIKLETVDASGTLISGYEVQGWPDSVDGHQILVQGPIEERK